MRTCLQIIRESINTCRVQPTLCKDSTNERNGNLFTNYRVQPILCKDTKIISLKSEIQQLFLFLFPNHPNPYTSFRKQPTKHLKNAL